MISIIVPIYNVEQYLERCISSIVHQTYQEIEIILVDDGSTDNCPSICDKYAKEDERIKVIHQENGGLSQARNSGLELAKGEYISFVDGDDWIESNMYEVLMGVLQKTDTDIAVCNYQTESEDSKYHQLSDTSYEVQLYSSEEALKRIINADGFIRTVVWNKLFKRDVIMNERFPIGKIYEDTLWTARVVGNAKSLSAVNCSLYHYQYRPDSLSNSNQQLSKRLLDKVELSEIRLDYLRKNYPQLEKVAIFKLQELCYEQAIVITMSNRHFDKSGELRRELQRHFCHSGPLNIQDVVGWKNKVGRIAFLICPNLFLWVYRIILLKKVNTGKTKAQRHGEREKKV